MRHFLYFFSDLLAIKNTGADRVNSIQFRRFYHIQLKKYSCVHNYGLIMHFSWLATRTDSICHFHNVPFSWIRLVGNKLILKPLICFVLQGGNQLHFHKYVYHWWFLILYRRTDLKNETFFMNIWIILLFISLVDFDVVSTKSA